jgi:hypothetical protein
MNKKLDHLSEVLAPSRGLLNLELLNAAVLTVTRYDHMLKGEVAGSADAEILLARSSAGGVRQKPLQHHNTSGLTT